jgi:catechol 2,3-dioxygenase-like lactoylglutathione lyase family enzyme
MARTVQITFDAADPHQLIQWWADLLGYQVEDSHDFVASLLEQGAITETDVLRKDGRLAFADGVAARDPAGVGPRLFVQRVPEGKTAKNRLHLDVRVGQDVLDDEVARVQAIGARFVEWNSHPGHRWAVMQDPEGNEFCLT